MNVEELNAASEPRLREVLLACCDAPAFARAVAGGRPYADLDALLDAADAAARRLTQAEVDQALAAHPRIGERAAGERTEQAWSRQEQAAVLGDGGDRAELVQANRDYEERFGRVFLICATGLRADQVVAAARERLQHDDETEQRVVADELRKIALLRLRKAVVR